MNTSETRTGTNTRSDGRAEFGRIPRWAYVAAAVVFLGTLSLFFGFGFVFGEEGGEGGGFVFWRLLPLIPATLLAFMTLMVGYVNADAGRRGMKRWLWTLIVIFVPNALGFILYFLLRNPVQQHCPKCGAVVDTRFNYCPGCRYAFHATCPKCQSAVRNEDTFCANCGSSLTQQAPL